MNSNKGFTLIQTVVTVAVVGVLAAIASVSYGKHLAKAQVSEAISMLEQHKVQSMVQLTKNGTCDNSTSVRGKYGEISISGTVVSTSLNTTVQRKTGCMLTYTFNNTDVVSSLKGKKIVVELYNNSVLSKSSQTNVDASALPKALTALTEDPIPKKEIVNATDIYVAKDTVGIPPDPEPTGEYDYMQDVKYGDLYCYTKRTGYPHHTVCYIYSKDRKKVLGTISGMQYDGPYLMTYDRVSAELVYLLATGQCPTTSVSVSAIKNECTKAGYRNCSFSFSGNCQLKLKDPPAGKILLETGWRENSGPSEGSYLYNFRNFYFDAKHEKP